VRKIVSQVGDSIEVGKGVVSDTDDGIRFGGRYAFSGTDREPAMVELATWDKHTKAVHVELREGETFEIAGQTWRLDKIHNEGVRRWYADLTRTA
jgi:hypothetical protein